MRTAAIPSCLVSPPAAGADDDGAADGDGDGDDTRGGGVKSGEE